MSDWTFINIADHTTLPPLDTPVWLMAEGIESPFIGERFLEDGFWYWAYCYDYRWSADGGWTSDNSDADDFTPTHWMPLPEPPRTS